jgi:hypothetical protein
MPLLFRLQVVAPLYTVYNVALAHDRTVPAVLPGGVQAIVKRK